MRSLIGLPILFVVVFSQSIPNVILTGEPRVVARRILNVDLKTAQQLALPDDNQHERYRVNILENQPFPETPYLTGEQKQVIVYRRILRPARIVFTGEGVVTDRWQSRGDALEMESWTLAKRPLVDGAFVRPQTRKV